MNPIVSVIIPTYNRSSLIRDTLLSVTAQTFGNLEIIVSDDGSIDNTKEVVAGLCDARIQYHWFRRQGCPAFPRNQGIRLAKGEYISFLDSDDLWRPNHIELCLSTLQGREDADGTFTDYLKMFPGNKLVHQNMAGSKYGAFTLQGMVTQFSSIGAASNVFLRSSVFKKAGLFNEDKRMAGSEDWEMWVRIAAKCRFIVIPEATAILRVHGKNITLDPEKIEVSINAALDSVYSNEAILPLIAACRKHAYAQVNTLAAINYYAAGDMPKARKRLWKALHYRPAHLIDKRFIWTFFRTMLGKKLSFTLRRLKLHFQSLSSRE